MADRITINVELGNAAMLTPAEVSGALEASLRRTLGVWDDGPLITGESGSIRDLNGNTVGSWEVE